MVNEQMQETEDAALDFVDDMLEGQVFDVEGMLSQASNPGVPDEEPAIDDQRDIPIEEKTIKHSHNSPTLMAPNPVVREKAGEESIEDSSGEEINEMAQPQSQAVAHPRPQTTMNAHNNKQNYITSKSKIQRPQARKKIVDDSSSMSENEQQTYAAAKPKLKKTEAPCLNDNNSSNSNDNRFCGETD